MHPAIPACSLEGSIPFAIEGQVLAASHRCIPKRAPHRNSLALYERLRADICAALVPIIVLTGNAGEDCRTKGYVIGTDDHISKPFTIPGLNARVIRPLHRTYGV